MLLSPCSSEGQGRATKAEEVEASSVFIIDLAFAVCNFMCPVSADSMQAFAMDRGRYLHRPLSRQSVHCGNIQEARTKRRHDAREAKAKVLERKGACISHSQELHQGGPSFASESSGRLSDSLLPLVLFLVVYFIGACLVVFLFVIAVPIATVVATV